MAHSGLVIYFRCCRKGIFVDVINIDSQLTLNKPRLPSIMWVEAIQSVECLKRKTGFLEKKGFYFKTAT